LIFGIFFLKNPDLFFLLGCVFCVVFFVSANWSELKETKLASLTPYSWTI